MSARRDRRIALLAGGALALIFTLCSAFQVAAWSVGKVERTTHRVFAGPADELVIQARSGDVTILPARDGRVRVESRSEGAIHIPDPVIEGDGARLRVAANCPVWGFGDCHSALVVHVPADAALEVESSSGDITADGLSGGAELRTASGDVSVRALSGNLALESASGDVDARGLRAPIVRARTASGDVELGFAVAPNAVEAETASGDARITVPDGSGPYQVDVETHSGDREEGVHTSPTATRLLRARTSSGDATVGYSG